MARWDEDRYDYEPRRGRQDERGYGSREGLRGAGLRDWEEERHQGRGRDPMHGRDYDRGREYDRNQGMNRDYTGRDSASRLYRDYNRDDYDRNEYGRGFGGAYGRSYGRDDSRSFARDFDRNFGGGYGRDYDRDYDPDYSRDMGRRGGDHLTEQDRAILEGRRFDRDEYDTGYAGERWNEGRGRGYAGSRYGMDSGRVTFERRGEHHGRGPKGWTRSNERVREDVSERMSHDGHLDASNIEIDVKDGDVTLTGTVPNRLQKRRAEDITENVSGVRDVHNRLTIQRETESAQRQTREGRPRGAAEA